MSSELLSTSQVDATLTLCPGEMSRLGGVYPSQYLLSQRCCLRRLPEMRRCVFAWLLQPQAIQGAFWRSIHLSPRSVTAGVRLFRWPCSISIHLSPRSATAGVRPFRLAMQHVRPFPLAMEHFYSFGLSLVVSALFRWPRSISIHSSPRSVTGGVRPFLLAM